MASLLPQLFLDSGAGLTPSDGALLHFNVVGSGTDKNTYTTAAATVANANPVVADSKGVFPPIYISGAYDWVLQNKNAVQQNTGTVNEVLLASEGAFPKNIATLALAVADNDLADGDAINLAERTAGNGGGAMWDVVLSSDVTEDTFSIVQCTGVATLSLVLRTDGEFHGDQFGMVFDGTTDDTLAMAACSVAAIPTKAEVQLRVGSTLITDTISFPVGAKFAGEKTEQLADSFGIDPLSTTILFEPSTAKSLFVSDGTSHGGFRFHNSVTGIYIVNTNGNGASALDLNGVIYSSFSNLAIKGFVEGINCDATINNSFRDVLVTTCTTAAVAYEGNNETTDVWDRCSFFGSPVGNLFRGSSIGVRFTQCLYEQLNDGAIVAKECQSIMYDSCYAEDVVFDNVSTGAMFKVGLTGTTLVTENQLIVTGGKYSGRNAGAQGSFVSADDCNGIMITGVNSSRWVTGIKTTANTRDNSIILNGLTGIAVTTQIDDFDKIVGVYPHSNIGDAGAESRIRIPVMRAEEVIQDTTTGLIICRASEKLGFFATAPVVQPTGTGETVGFTAGGGTTATSASTATGNLGSTAYRHSDIVKALKQLGILAL